MGPTSGRGLVTPTCLAHLHCKLLIIIISVVNWLCFCTPFFVLLYKMAMESALVRRDRIGVQDFVLLEDYRNENAFMENLRKRFKEKLIYVS